MYKIFTGVLTLVTGAVFVASMTYAQTTPQPTDLIATAQANLAEAQVQLRHTPPGVTNTPLATSTETATVPTNTPVPLDTPTIPPATITAIPPATLTAIPVVTLTPTATSTAAVPISGQLCPKAVHDAVLTFGPNGKPYPTWHPAVDVSTGCFFGHEHGADPSTSAANSSPVAFGYVADVAGKVEPHEGYKVSVVHYLTPGDQGPSPADYRIVHHTGTGRTGRYLAQFHTMDNYDYVARDGTGRYFHIMGVSDTHPTALNGSTCSVPRTQGKDFSTLGCADPYEIWNNVSFSIIHPSQIGSGPNVNRLSASFAPAVFDPITTVNPADLTQLLYTQQVRGDPRFHTTKDANGNWIWAPQVHSPLSPNAYYLGCRREVYGGPNYFVNAQGLDTYTTDAYGLVDPTGNGPLVQRIGLVSTQLNDIVKVRQDYCDPGIRSPN